MRMDHSWGGGFGGVLLQASISRARRQLTASIRWSTVWYRVILLNTVIKTCECDVVLCTWIECRLCRFGAVKSR